MSPVGSWGVGFWENTWRIPVKVTGVPVSAVVEAAVEISKSVWCKHFKMFPNKIYSTNFQNLFLHLLL